ncbi:hypothetical protein [Haloferax chudinovii]|uniref:PD-(D/E)XK nuclease superfamily protein n=1 Tax=Haloferax chudinovii TaxID=1109010 RepID=A0ABD5XLS8_9EURY
MVDLRSSIFSKIASKEVPFNYQFGALLGYSLATGSDLIEVVHQRVTLDDETRLVALQDYSELDETIDEDVSDCQIDIAFIDRTTIVGIESKRDDDLTKNQLDRELRVLEQNAEGRDVVLLAVTEDTNRPGVIERVDKETEHTVLWSSWHRIALQFEEELSDGYEPIRHMVNDLFDDTGYTLQFEGFPEPALDSAVYLEWLQQFKHLMYDLETVLHSGPLYLNRGSGQNLPSFASKNTSSSNLEEPYHQPAAVALFVPFTTDAGVPVNNYGKSAHVSLYGNYHDDEVGVFLDLNPMYDGWSKDVIEANQEEIVDSVLENDMFLRISRNSHCHYDFPPKDLTTRAEISDFVEEKIGTKNGKRVMIGRFSSEEETPRETVESFASELEFFHDYFFEDGKIFGQYRTE